MRRRLREALSSLESFDSLYSDVVETGVESYTKARRFRSLLPLLYNMACIHMQRKRYDRAEEILSQVSKNYEGEGWSILGTEIKTKLATCYRELGKWTLFVQYSFNLLNSMSSTLSLEEKRATLAELVSVARASKSSIPSSSEVVLEVECVKLPAERPCVGEGLRIVVSLLNKSALALPCDRLSIRFHEIGQDTRRLSTGSLMEIVTPDPSSTEPGVLLDVIPEDAESHLAPPQTFVKPPTTNWIDRQLSSRHVLFVSNESFTLQPGRSKITLEGMLKFR